MQAETSMQMAFRAWSVVEQRLKRAAEENHPISVSATDTRAGW